MATATVPFTTQLHQQIDYSASRVTKKLLVEDPHGKFRLVCCPSGTTIPAVAPLHNLSLAVLEGRGVLDIEDGRQVVLEPGVFIYIPARTVYELQAIENLALLQL